MTQPLTEARPGNESECVGKMEIKRQGVRGRVVWREVGVWKTNLPKSIWEGELCAKLSLTEILYTIKDLSIMPKHMKYCFHPNAASPSLSFFLFTSFTFPSSVTLFPDIFHLLIITANNRSARTEECTQTPPLHAPVCLAAILEVVSPCVEFCSVCQHQHKHIHTRAPESSPLV